MAKRTPAAVMQHTEVLYVHEHMDGYYFISRDPLGTGDGQSAPLLLIPDDAEGKREPAITALIDRQLNWMQRQQEQWGASATEQAWLEQIQQLGSDTFYAMAQDWSRANPNPATHQTEADALHDEVAALRAARRHHERNGREYTQEPLSHLDQAVGDPKRQTRRMLAKLPEFLQQAAVLEAAPLVLLNRHTITTYFEELDHAMLENGMYLGVQMPFNGAIITSLRGTEAPDTLVEELTHRADQLLGEQAYGEERFSALPEYQNAIKDWLAKPMYNPIAKDIGGQHNRFAKTYVAITDKAYASRQGYSRADVGLEVLADMVKFSHNPSHYADRLQTIWTRLAEQKVTSGTEAEFGRAHQMAYLQPAVQEVNAILQGDTAAVRRAMVSLYSEELVGLMERFREECLTLQLPEPTRMTDAWVSLPLNDAMRDALAEQVDAILTPPAQHSASIVDYTLSRLADLWRLRHAVEMPSILEVTDDTEAFAAEIAQLQQQQPELTPFDLDAALADLGTRESTHAKPVTQQAA